MSFLFFGIALGLPGTTSAAGPDLEQLCCSTAVLRGIPLPVFFCVTQLGAKIGV